MAVATPNWNKNGFSFIHALNPEDDDDDDDASVTGAATDSLEIEATVDFVVEADDDGVGPSIDAFNVLEVEWYTRRALHDITEQLEALYTENILYFLMFLYSL